MLVSASRAILSGETGLSIGAFRIRNIFHSITGEQLDKQYPIFEEFISKIPSDIPVGSARLKWEANELMKRDKILNKAENKYREKILWASIEIIKKFGQPCAAGDSSTQRDAGSRTT